MSMLEHFNNLNKLKKIDNINNILDAGSGRSSLNYLLKTYDCNIDAIIYPGDIRKINGIKNTIKGNYNLIEKDIVKDKIDKEYDLVLAHLLLGEATMFNNKFIDLFEKLLNIKSKYYIIYDYKEDVNIDYNYINEYIKNNNFEIIDYKEFKKDEDQVFKNFIGKTYVAYIIKKI